MLYSSLHPNSPQSRISASICRASVACSGAETFYTRLNASTSESKVASITHLLRTESSSTRKNT